MAERDGRQDGRTRSIFEGMPGTAISPLDAGLAPPADGDFSTEYVIEHISRVQSTAHCPFRGFDEEDVAVLCTRLSITPFRAGEMIVAKGEAASWVGIILQGDLEVCVAVNLTFPLHRGDLIGEFAVFEHGVRSNNVLAATDGLMGVITFDDLDALSAELPALGFKLLRIFGACSLKKLYHSRARMRSSAGGTTGLARAAQPPSASAMHKLLVNLLPASMLLSSAFTADELRPLAEELAPCAVNFTAGQTIAHQGGEVRSALLLLQGELIEIEDSSLEPRKAKPGDLMAEGALFFHKTSSEALLVAQSDGVFLDITHEAVWSLAQKHNALR